MIHRLLRLFGLANSKPDSEKFEPVFGLPKQSIDEWLSRHRSMKERYDAELARLSKPRRRSYKEDRYDGYRHRTPLESDHDRRT
jgi:hypothetical protein